jgi:transketolase
MTAVSGRDAFGKALLELAEQNEKVVALTADLAEAIRVHWFAEQYPERFFQIGIAEQDMIGTAAGLAMTGWIPFATTFAVFAANRANEQIRMAVCYNEANVKIAVSHGGITPGEDGATHQGLEDIAAMRLMPGMTVVVPADADETRLATFAAAELQGPVYLRLGRLPFPAVTDRAEQPFVIGKARTLRSGTDVSLIACGIMVGMAWEASERLQREGISASVIDMHTIKPIDREAILSEARKTGCIVTAEEHSVLGGLGGAVAEVLTEHEPVPLVRVGTMDTFGESGEPMALLAKYGLTPEAIVEAAKTAIQKKRTGGEQLVRGSFA